VTLEMGRGGEEKGLPTQRNDISLVRFDETTSGCCFSDIKLRETQCFSGPVYPISVPELFMIKMLGKFPLSNIYINGGKNVLSEWLHSLSCRGHRCWNSGGNPLEMVMG